MTSVNALYGSPKVGSDTLSYCGKCRMDLAHVIVSMVERRPAKVICKTCKSEHRYRGSVGVGTSGPATRAPRKATERTTIRVADLWEKKLAESKAAAKKAYNVADTFLKGDVIEHPQFGTGLIEEVRSSSKIAVLFKDAERVLVHGFKAS